MLHAGLDLSRRKVDVCLLSSAGEIVDDLVLAGDCGDVDQWARTSASAHDAR
jgi:hypothetical protein